MEKLSTLIKKIDKLYKRYCCLYLEVTALNNLAAYADDAAAGVGGLTTGQLYQTSGSGAAPLNVSGIVMTKQ